MALSVLAERLGAKFKSHKSNASVAEARLGAGGPKVILAKPGSYMNTSGGPVTSLMKFFDLDIAHVVVLHDELDIPAESDDGQPYRLAERVRQLADLAELVLISAVDTSRSKQMVRELKRLQQQNYVLNNEIKFMRAQEGKPS